MFRPDNATAMAVYYLTLAPNHTLGDLVLMKLMVIAERECMAQTTSLITGAQFASMQNGPVLSEVLNLIKGDVHSALWSYCIEFVPHAGPGTPSNYCVLKCGLDVTEYLSEFEIGLLTSVWKKHGNKKKWDLVDLTHTFPEWDKSCAETKSSKPIPLNEIYALGLNESAEQAKERAEEIEYFEAVSA